MPSISTILERLRWKVGLGLVIVAAGFAASAAPSADLGSSDVARSSWGFSSQSSSEAEDVDVARSSWGFSRSSSEADAEVVDVARSSWGFARSPRPRPRPTPTPTPRSTVSWGERRANSLALRVPPRGLPPHGCRPPVRRPAPRPRGAVRGVLLALHRRARGPRRDRPLRRLPRRRRQLGRWSPSPPTRRASSAPRSCRWRAPTRTRSASRPTASCAARADALHVDLGPDARLDVALREATAVAAAPRVRRHRPGPDRPRAAAVLAPAPARRAGRGRGAAGGGHRLAVRRHRVRGEELGPGLHRALVVGPGPGLPGRRRLRRLRRRPDRARAWAARRPRWSCASRTALLRLAPPFARMTAAVGESSWRIRARSARHSLELEGEAAGEPAVLPGAGPGPARGRGPLAAVPGGAAARDAAARGGGRVRGGVGAGRARGVGRVGRPALPPPRPAAPPPPAAPRRRAARTARPPSTAPAAASARSGRPGRPGPR